MRNINENNNNQAEVAKKTSPEDSHNMWWFNITDHKALPNQQKRQIIKGYTTGSILHSIHPEYKKDIPLNLRMGFFGRTGAGKSSAITTILTSVYDSEIQWWRSEYGQDVVDQRLVRQLGPESHLIEVGELDGKQMYIELVDNRGLLDESNIEEAVDVLDGGVSVNNRIQRLGDDEYIGKFASGLEQKNERLNLSVVVIPADLPEEKLALYVDLQKSLRKTLIPVLCVFTKTDIEGAEEKIKKLMSSLDLSANDCKQMTCYSANGHNVADEDINSQALHVLMYAMIIADSKGIPIKDNENYFSQQAVATIKALKTSVVQQIYFIVGICIVVIVLFLYLFKSN